jgi:hypothetical protein
MQLESFSVDNGWRALVFSSGQPYTHRVVQIAGEKYVPQRMRLTLLLFSPLCRLRLHFKDVGANAKGVMSQKDVHKLVSSVVEDKDERCVR